LRPEIRSFSLAGGWITPLRQQLSGLDRLIE
jgi:hypothetical protein